MPSAIMSTSTYILPNLREGSRKKKKKGKSEQSLYTKCVPIIYMDVYDNANLKSILFLSKKEKTYAIIQT